MVALIRVMLLRSPTLTHTLNTHTKVIISLASESFKLTKLNNSKCPLVGITMALKF